MWSVGGLKEGWGRDEQAGGKNEGETRGASGREMLLMQTVQIERVGDVASLST